MRTTHNPITFRLEKLRSLWASASDNPEVKVVCWLIKADEYTMLESLVEIESSEHGEIPDLIVKFSAPFLDIDVYDEALAHELHQKITSYNQQESDQPIDFSFDSTNGEGKSYPFIKQIASFAASIEELENNMVIYLQPEINHDLYQWSDWLLRVLEDGIPEGIKIMVTDILDNEQSFADESYSTLFKKIVDLYPESIKILYPDLEMDLAIKELAPADNKQSPGAKFRSLFMKMGEVGAKGNLEKAKELQKEAMAIAAKESNKKGVPPELNMGWSSMKIVSQMLMGNLMLGGGKIQEAIKEYDRVINSINQSTENENEEGQKLIVQTLLSKAGALYTVKEYDLAAETYESAAIEAEKNHDFMNQVESLRMAGHCYLKDKEYSHSMKILVKALEELERNNVSIEKKKQDLKQDKNMDLVQKDNQLLQLEFERTQFLISAPCLGLDLIKLIRDHRQGRYEDEISFQERLDKLLGANWEERCNFKSKNKR